MLKLILLLACVASVAEAKTAKKSGERDVGLGGGIFTVYPPMITLDGAWRLSKWAAFGLNAGYLTVPVDKFEGSSTYLGVEGRYFFTGGSWFGALGLGRRTFEITTYNDVTVDGRTTEVAWKRHVSQKIVYPQVGWMSWSKGGDSLMVAGGLVVPIGTTFTIEHDPEIIPGLTQANLDSEEAEREGDVKAVTNRVWPSFELKYAHFFAWLK